MTLPEASYLPVNPGLDVARTLAVGDGLLVDVSINGRVVGVERVGGPVDAEALIAVLRALTVDGVAPDSHRSGDVRNLRSKRPVLQGSVEDSNPADIDADSDVDIAEQMPSAGGEDLMREEPSLSSQCRRGDCDGCDFGSIHTPCQHGCHTAW